MYLSVMTAVPNRAKDAATPWAGGPAAEHAWLATLLAKPGGAPGVPDFLFRRSEASGVPRFHVLSYSVPCIQDGEWSIHTQIYAPKLAAGAITVFELRANPMITETRGGRSQRHDVMTRENLRQSVDQRAPQLRALVQRSCGEWLQSRAARHGFEVVADTLCVEDFRQHLGEGLNATGNGAQIESQDELNTVNFRGELRVVDPVTFGSALQRGIGRAKQYGCGLLLIRP